MSEDELITLDETDCEDVVAVSTDEERPPKRCRSRSPLITVHFGSAAVCSRYQHRVATLLKAMLRQEHGADVHSSLHGQRLLLFSGGRQSPPQPPPQSPPQRPCRAGDMVSDERPQYEVSVSGVVGAAEADRSGAAPSSGRRANCFNCDGDHLLHECSEPRDLARIARNRRVRCGPQSGRYHDNLESRRSGLRPGVISGSLRRALGLRSDQLPQHVLRMRRLGYPPGWLEAARRVPKLRLHTRTARPAAAVLSPDHSSPSYDAAMLVTFPGFNDSDPARCETPAGCLSYSQGQSLQQMRLQLCRGEPDASVSSDSDCQVLVTDSPEEGEVSEASEEEVVPAAAAAESLTDLSLQQLHERRQNLLHSLSSPNHDSALPALSPLAQSTPCPTGVRPRDGASLHVHLGTPVAAERGGGGDSLPAMHKWAAGISQHIPFENLPGATGSWNRLRGLVDRVRARAKEGSSGPVPGNDRLLVPAAAAAAEIVIDS